ncbi:hypothetical protein D3C85_1297380 [compost metagenome]
MPPPTRASAITVRTGSPTAVSRKPRAAVQTCSPACKPTMGGKMMLPAPTKSAKVINPKATISLGANCRFIGVSYLSESANAVKKPVEICVYGIIILRNQEKIFIGFISFAVAAGGK